jgi:hypothetical protein
VLKEIFVLIFGLILQYTNSHTIMKTAEQLRELALNHKTISLAAIEYQCTKAAESGGTSVMLFDREISAADLQLLCRYDVGIKVGRFNDAEAFTTNYLGTFNPLIPKP